MTSRIPPSQRDPRYGTSRVARAVAEQTPGVGRVPAASPVVSQQTQAALRGLGTPAASPVLHVSASASDAPENGEPFWYRTDLSC